LHAETFYTETGSIQMLICISLACISDCPPSTVGAADSSDVKRGQNLEAETEATDKVMNKKYQMMFDNIQVNLYHYEQNDTAYLILILSRTVTIFHHSVMSWSRRCKLQRGWSVCLFLAAGSSAADRGCSIFVPRRLISSISRSTL